MAQVSVPAQYFLTSLRGIWCVSVPEVARTVREHYAGVNAKWSITLVVPRLRGRFRLAGGAEEGSKHTRLSGYH